MWKRLIRIILTGNRIFIIWFIFNFLKKNMGFGQIQSSLGIMPSEDVRYKEDCSVWKTTFVWKLKNKQTYKQTNSISSTIRPGNSDPFYTVSYYIYMGHYLLEIQYYIKWFTTSWTHSTVCPRTLDSINYYSMSRK